MATKLTESRHLYSWWWDSHISPKNSKWLQENLTDIDSKVKSMIKIINEDADSFARRAEMYYKKRPELMKLVEEFYRAYRALADRYDHATGELRLAHRTMIEAFPNQVPFTPNDDPSSGSELASLVAPHLDGLKQLHEMFQSGEATLRELKTVESRLRGNSTQGEEDKDSKLSERNHGLDLRTMILNESERAVKVEAEMQRLRQALAKMEAERDSVLAQYKQILEKLSNLEKELNSAKEDAMELEKCANEAQGDVKALRECLQKSEIERDSSLYRFEEASKRIASLEVERQELLRSEAEKQDALDHYQQSLEKITELEEKLRVAEENDEGLSRQNEEARSEVKALKEEIERLNKEKDDAYLRYQQCLEMISKLHNELTEAKEEVRRLKGSEDKCVLLEGVNQSLKLEANGLVQQITVKDQELSEKDTELEKLMSRLHDERSRFMQVEAALQKLEDMHFQSQEEQRSLAIELRDGIRMLRELEICKKDLELENQCLKEENRGLNDLKLASCVVEKDMQDEILALKETKEKQVEQNEDLQEQFAESRQELEELYKKYQDLLMQVESDEEKMEKEALLRKLEGMESSLSDVKIELESSKKKVKALQESCKSLGGDKSNLMSEKSALLSQLQIITESMQKLLEKNVLLETSLQSAYIELEGLRAKSKGLEDFCRFLRDERSTLQSEKSSLVYRLECVEKKLEKLETRFKELEDKYVGQVEELRISLVLETKERECVVLTSEARLLGLEERVRRLHEENKCGKREFKEQLEKGVSAQVEIFILKKFMEDMEERNSVLLAECCNNAEAAKFSEKLISELESENMMQHLETEYLMDRVEDLRRGICQVLKALEIDHVTETDPEAFLKEIRRNLSKSKDESQELLVQNNVLSAVIRELSSEGMELKGRKEAIDKEVFLLNKHNAMLEQDKDELLVRNKQLEMAMVEKESGQETLKAQMESLGLKQESLEKKYAILQVRHSDARNENRVLQEKLIHIEEEKCMLEDENSEVIVEALDLNNQLVVFQNSWIQTVLESGKVAQDMLHLQEAYSDLENEARALGGKLVMKETENVQLRELLQQFEAKNREFNVSNDRLNKKCLVQRELLAQKDTELLEAEKRMKTVQFTNTELRVALDVNRESLEERIVELSEGKEQQEKEIVLLQEANKCLENEVSVLTQEIEACKVREVSLNSELHEVSSEFEIWEAEATSFYFDLQMSSVRESLLENKVQELSRLCEDLQDVGDRRSMEIEELNNKVSFLECDREGLRSKLASYVPVIASLKENIASLEQISALQTKESESKSTNAREQSSSVSDELSDLQDLQSRIKAIESALIVKNSAKESTTTKAPAKQRSRNNSQSNVMAHHDSERKTELRNGIHMKDIPLDHVSDGSPSRMRRRKSSRLSDQLLELWETSDLDSSHNLALSRTRGGRFSPPRRNAGEIEKELGVDKLELTESKQRGNKKAILERLASDAQKLASLQVSVQELRRKMEINKKSKSFKGVEYKSLRSQIHGVENSVVQLVSMNTELTKTVKGSGSRELVEVEQVLRRKIQEQSRKESERIGSLELEMQKIQSLLVEAEDEKSSIKKVGKNGSPRSRTRIILREFVYGPSRIRKQKKPRFCGCFRQPQKEV